MHGQNDETVGVREGEWTAVQLAHDSDVRRAKRGQESSRTHQQREASIALVWREDVKYQVGVQGFAWASLQLVDRVWQRSKQRSAR